MSGAPARTKALIGSLRSDVYPVAARIVALIPRPPGVFACGGSRCAARSRLGNPAPIRPGGAPHYLLVATQLSSNRYDDNLGA